MKVAIDIGNTRAKAALFSGKELLEIKEGIPLEEVPDWVASKNPSGAIIASVNTAVQELKERVAAVCPCLVLDPDLPVPIKKKYKSPQTLGADRLAASVGGRSIFPAEAVLVIDAGTCITYDYVSAEGIYSGGAISPGVQMRFKALHNFTAGLPLLDNVSLNVPVLGQDTAGSITSGVLHGTCAEVEEMINKFREDLGPFRTIICGGDTKFFETKIKRPIFVVPELVLIGLNEILLYNAAYK